MNIRELIETTAEKNSNKVFLYFADQEVTGCGARCVGALYGLGGWLGGSVFDRNAATPRTVDSHLVAAPGAVVIWSVYLCYIFWACRSGQRPF